MTTTPEQFLALLTASQEERDAAEPVPPVAGQLHLLRHGGAMVFFSDSWNIYVGHPSQQCIATLDLASVLAELVASRARIKELERGVLDGLSQWGQDHQGVDG